VTINSVLPALIAGNAVLLKPSPQTPLTAERFADALKAAGLPDGLMRVLHLSPSLSTRAIQHSKVEFVSFTGSVAGGRAVERAAVEAEGFKGVALEVHRILRIPSDETEHLDVSSWVERTQRTSDRTPTSRIRSQSSLMVSISRLLWG